MDNRHITKGINPMLLMMISTLFYSCSGNSSQQITPPTEAKVYGAQSHHAQEKELLRLMNQARRQRGRKPLVIDPRLTRAAQTHSNSMHKHGYFAHIGKDGSDFQKRLLRENYPRCYSAENLAIAFSPVHANRLWLNSPGHKKNLLGKKYTRVGIGIAGKYWTVNYAEPMGPIGGN